MYDPHRLEVNDVVLFERPCVAFFEGIPDVEDPQC